MERAGRGGADRVSLRIATPALVSQQVRSIMKIAGENRVIAMRAEPTWTAGDLLVDDRRVEVRNCVSPLAVRSCLADWAQRDVDTADGAPSDVMVVLCDLSEGDLGDDVMARLARRRVSALDPWEASRSLFGVHRMDAAFGKDDAWIPSALLSYVSADVAGSKMAGTTLTREVALNALASAVFGASDLSVDALLNAGADTAPFAKLATVDEATRSGLLVAISQTTVPLGAVVAGILGAGLGNDLVAIGIAARAIYGTDGHDGGKDAGRLQERCGGGAISGSIGVALATRCEETLANLFATDRNRANVLRARAEALAEDLEVSEPEASRFLLSGFNRRIMLAVAALQDVLAGVDGKSPADVKSMPGLLSRLRVEVAAVGTHVEASMPGGRRRKNHLEMAARLATWLASEESKSDSDSPKSFEQAASAYAATSAWVDRARRVLWRGDDDAEVAAAYSDLIERVVARRRMENRRFAELLAGWTTAPSSPDVLATNGLMTVESVVPRVLTKFGEHPVLFVVLDGCGLPSFIELAPQFAEAGFREITMVIPGAPADQESGRMTGIAVLPTVTEVSRASLIAGELDRGDQLHERGKFEGNPAIRRDGQAAAFFHQNRLLGAAGESLSAEVLKALDGSGPRVVGVVINTIDDQLRKGTFTDELRIEDLHSLVSLLDAARNNGWAVVVGADHGHVLAQPDEGGSGTFDGDGGSGGERWREADHPAKDGEVLLKGERVRLGSGGSILAPWEDDYRYAAKAGGYHGGASPAEVLVPVAAFLPAGIQIPAGWMSFTETSPLWWDIRVDEVSPSTGGGATKLAKAKKKAAAVDKDQGSMFVLPPETGATGSDTQAKSAGPGWLDALFASAVWKSQLSGMTRGKPDEERTRAVLAAIARRGNVISFATLAHDAPMPRVRVAGFLANLKLVLNVDNYEVLDVNATTEEARLSVGTLCEQFQIDVGTS